MNNQLSTFILAVLNQAPNAQLWIRPAAQGFQARCSWLPAGPVPASLTGEGATVQEALDELEKQLYYTTTEEST